MTCFQLGRILEKILEFRFSDSHNSKIRSQVASSSYWIAKLQFVPPPIHSSSVPSSPRLPSVRISILRCMPGSLASRISNLCHLLSPSVPAQEPTRGLLLYSSLPQLPFLPPRLLMLSRPLEIGFMQIAVFGP